MLDHEPLEESKDAAGVLALTAICTGILMAFSPPLPIFIPISGAILACFLIVYIVRRLD